MSHPLVIVKDCKKCDVCDYQIVAIANDSSAFQLIWNCATKTLKSLLHQEVNDSIENGLACCSSPTKNFWRNAKEPWNLSKHISSIIISYLNLCSAWDIFQKKTKKWENRFFFSIKTFFVFNRKEKRRGIGWVYGRFFSKKREKVLLLGGKLKFRWLNEIGRPEPM